MKANPEITELRRRVERLETFMHIAPMHLSPVIEQISFIQKQVATHFGITMPELVGFCRRREFCWPRHVAMYLSRTVTRASFHTIARQFRRDHAGVQHGCRCVENRCSTEPNTAAQIEKLELTFKPANKSTQRTK